MNCQVFLTFTQLNLPAPDTVTVQKTKQTKAGKQKLDAPYPGMEQRISTGGNNGTGKEDEDGDDSTEYQHESEGSEDEDDEDYSNRYPKPPSKRSKQTCCRNGTNTTKISQLPSINKKSKYIFIHHIVVANWKCQINIERSLQTDEGGSTHSRAKRAKQDPAREERWWRVDGRPPVMEPETRNILINFGEVDSLTGSSKLEDLFQSILNAHPISPNIPDTQHGVFKTLLQSCANWERDTVLHDFNHFMALLQLSVYIAR